MTVHEERLPLDMDADTRKNVVGAMESIQTSLARGIS